MCLPVSQVDRFYIIWKPLLIFVNERGKLAPDLLGASLDTGIKVEDAVRIRDELWKDDALLDAFISQNPANLSAEDLALAMNWKYRREGSFFVYKSLKKYAIFINDRKKPEVFAIKGLYSSFEEIFPYMPILVRTVLLPFGHEIICDGLFQFYNVTFGSGVRGNLKAIYDDAKERGEIITSLLTVKQPLSLPDQAAKAEARNSKVMEEFKEYLYRSELTPKIVERDLASVAQFAAENLENSLNPHLLQEIESGELFSFLSDLPETARRHAGTSFKRFVQFMRDSGRLKWDEANELLVMLKNL
jgi:hypothetical protein